uniref:Integrase zinc-binding domain-containing protein n=1 Tax=Trichobilharzia regenti TaxID=157069 RepID=A0AA85JXV3_TRIRE|nr:unnamed protein product [Trichobilharzia regenti]
MSISLDDLPVTAVEVARHTLRDPVLQQVSKFIRFGWPPHVHSNVLKQFYQRRKSLSIVNGCIMVADRVVVPANLRDHVLRQLHISHPGVGRMKAIARSYVYWPNIDDHIEDLVRKCSKCAQASKCPRKTELCSWPRPDKPWSRVHVDFAGPLNSMHFLICVDAFSKWPEIFPMHSATSIATVSLLRQLLLNVSSTPLSVLMQKRRGREQQKKILDKFLLHYRTNEKGQLCVRHTDHALSSTTQRSTRQRRAPKPLQIDPKSKSYTLYGGR